MNIETCIKERRSIRSYQPDKISHQDFEEIVNLAVYAPSWKNTQIARYTLVEDDAVKEHIAQHCVMGFDFNAKTLINAPNIVVISMVTGRSGYERDGSFSTSKGDRWQTFDAGVATQTFCLAAHAKGYGTVIMGVFDDDKIAKAVGLPEGQTVAAILALGTPAVSPEAPQRKTAKEVVTYVSQR